MIESALVELSTTQLSTATHSAIAGAAQLMGFSESESNTVLCEVKNVTQKWREVFPAKGGQPLKLGV